MPQTVNVLQDPSTIRSQEERKQNPPNAFRVPKGGALREAGHSAQKKVGVAQKE